MQATQRKIEYRPSSAAPRKRIVNMDGNVAYIRRGERPASSGNKAGTTHPVRVGASKSAAAKGKTASHPVRVGRGVNASPVRGRVVRGGATPASKSSVVVSANAAAKQSLNKAAKQAKRAHKGVVSTLFVIFAAFCALSLLISRYAAISAIGTENSKLKGDINALQVKIEELKVNMELQDNLEDVRNTALNVLGMTYPDQSQKVYLDMS
jgi:hypothetical protein